MSAPLSFLRDEVAQAFAADGPLARHDPQFRTRVAQLRLADEVAQALEARGVLVAEAGTGTGKTYAYLVPLLLSGRRALVSTATKSLQDQLFLRDLPRLVAQLGLGVQLALLKGRSSYLCLQRLELARQQAELPDRASVRLLARIEQWSQGTRKGDLAEIEGLDERSPLLPLVSSTRENCLGSECPRHRDCHLMAARREALQADLVVVNHHLFFADLALRDTGMAELLPSVEAVVFDEAHQLNEAGVNFLGRHLGSGQLLDYARDLLATGLAQARGLQDWAALAGAVEGAARRLRLACAGALRGAVRLRWEERAREPEFIAALESARLACVAASDALAACADGSPEFAKLRERAAELGRTVAGFVAGLPPGEVRWIDVSLHAARLAQAPLDIRETLRERVEDGSRAWIFTSATLGDDAELSWFTRSAGVEDAHTLRLDSPFDYARHGRLHVPSVFPRPNEAGHAEAVAALAARCAQALGGRTFVLTTTLRALREIGEGLRQRLASLAEPIEVLVQGEGPKRALLARFLATPRAVLVGSHSFWEGIDVPGRALQCVLIDKLPFPPPNDPLAEARCRSLEAQGQSPFDDYFVPEAAIALKQGAGRLIRSESDRGLLVICDSRLLRQNYGRRLLAALPPMPLLGEAEEAIAFLHELARDGEGEVADSAAA